jgi:hypothetical protein
VGMKISPDLTLRPAENPHRHYRPLAASPPPTRPKTRASTHGAARRKKTTPPPPPGAAALASSSPDLGRRRPQLPTSAHSNQHAGQWRTGASSPSGSRNTTSPVRGSSFDSPRWGAEGRDPRHPLHRCPALRRRRLREWRGGEEMEEGEGLGFCPHSRQEEATQAGFSVPSWTAAPATCSREAILLTCVWWSSKKTGQSQIEIIFLESLFFA